MDELCQGALNARVDRQDVSGSTPLHLAAKAGHEKLVRLLMDNEANIIAKDNEGKTALQLAAQNGHLNVVQQLLQIPNPLKVTLFFSFDRQRRGK